MSKSKKSTKPTKSAKNVKGTPARKQPPAGPTIPEALQTPEFAAAWAAWERFHADRGIELTAENTARQLELLARLGPDQAVEDIRNTIAEQPAPPPPEEVPAVASTELEPTAVARTEAETPLIASTEPAGTEVALTEPAMTEPAQTPTDAPTAAAPEKQQRATPKAPRPAGQLSAIDAAAQVLAAAGQPLTCQQMIEAMAAQGLWSSPKGKTPSGTLYAAILREQATKGAEARFVKAGRGQFATRSTV